MVRTHRGELRDPLHRGCRWMLGGVGVTIFARYSTGYLRSIMDVPTLGDAGIVSHWWRKILSSPPARTCNGYARTLDARIHLALFGLSTIFDVTAAPVRRLGEPILTNERSSSSFWRTFDGYFPSVSPARAALTRRKKKRIRIKIIIHGRKLSEPVTQNIDIPR